jgi:hypothetical protein
VSYAFQANVWYHIAVVLTTTDMILYVNGKLIGNTGAGLNASATGIPLTIGSTNDPAYTSERFTGVIDEMRIWNTVRTPAQLVKNMFNKDLAADASGLIAYYRFNENSGATTVNSCTNSSGIDGTLINSPARLSSPIQFGPNAMHFDQVNDRIIAPLPTAATSNVTIEAWVNHEGGTGTDHLLLVNGVMGSNGYALFINTLRQLIVIYPGVGTWNTGVNLPTNQWTHLALVISTTGLTLYRNGINVYSRTAVPNTPTTNLVIGYNTVANGQPFDGLIDEVRVWNSARTQSEIQNNMNKEVEPGTAGLVAYYNFNQGIAGGDNTGLTTLIDQTGNNNATLTNFAFSGTTSNYKAQNSSLFVLPLQWLSFTAQQQAANVLLEWRTAQEQNTRDFSIQHSKDGSTWNTIANVHANGNASSSNSYSYLHTSPVKGKNYYRIIQRDLDDRTSYSAMRLLNWQTNNPLIQIINNPVKNGSLELRVFSPCSVALYSSDGKLLWTKQLGMGAQSVVLNGCRPGLYFLRVGDTTNSLVVQ